MVKGISVMLLGSTQDFVSSILLSTDYGNSDVDVNYKYLLLIWIYFLYYFVSKNNLELNIVTQLCTLPNGTNNLLCCQCNQDCYGSMVLDSVSQITVRKIRRYLTSFIHFVLNRIHCYQNEYYLHIKRKTTLQQHVQSRQ